MPKNKTINWFRDYICNYLNTHVQNHLYTFIRAHNILKTKYPFIERDGIIINK